MVFQFKKQLTCNRISSKSVIDWRGQSKSTDLKPRITLRDEKGNVIKKLTTMKLDVIWYRLDLVNKDEQKVYAGDVMLDYLKKPQKQKI